MMSRHNSILETIGRTPIVRLNRIAPEHVNLYVKIESFNPMGSVKDRLALGVIEDGEKSGALSPGQTVYCPSWLKYSKNSPSGVSSIRSLLPSKLS